MEKMCVELALNQLVLITLVLNVRRTPEHQKMSKNSEKIEDTQHAVQRMYECTKTECVQKAVRRALETERRRTQLKIENAVLREKCLHLTALIEYWKSCATVHWAVEIQKR